MNREAVDRLLRQLKTLDVADLRAVLGEAFPVARYEGQRTIEYSVQGGHAMTLTYFAARPDRDPRGVAAELRPGPDLTDTDVVKLRELYDITRGPTTASVSAEFVMSDRPVTGHWKYRDDFQILPPPPSASLPPEELGDWPFVLETRLSAPANTILALNRRVQATDRLRLLLPVLLIGPIYQPHSYRGVKHWVWPQYNDVSLIGPPQWAQEGYHVPGWTAAGGPDLSPVGGLDAAVIIDDSDTYYRSHGRGIGDVLQIPAALPRLFDIYFGLDEGAARRYRRACYWFNLASFYWRYSASTSLLAYVIAIESLLANDPAHTCDTCGLQHHPSITKAFQKFLRQHVPDVPERDHFYSIRSSIAHGSALTTFDVRDEFSGFFPQQLDEHKEFRALSHTCRIALVNWLRSMG